jgi:hypothetical protein
LLFLQLYSGLVGPLKRGRVNGVETGIGEKIAESYCLLLNRPVRFISIVV